MGDQIAKGEEFVKKAEKKLSGWGLFGSKYDDAADLFDKAANCFKLAKSWDRAGAVYVKLASCHLKLDSKHEAAGAYANAAHCYKKTNMREAISCLEQAVHMFLDIGRLNMSARYYKEIAELYEQEQNLEQAITYYEKAADLFQSEDVTTTANQCKQKIAEFSAKLEKYQRAIEIFEEIAQHSIKNNLLKYGVRGHLLNAGICQLCRGDVVAINNALERYQELDPTFSGTRECKLLVDLEAAIDEEDVAKFTGCLKEYDSMTKLLTFRTSCCRIGRLSISPRSPTPIKAGGRNALLIFLTARYRSPLPVLYARFHNQSQIHLFEGGPIPRSSNCLEVEGFKNPFTSRAHRSPILCIFRNLNRRMKGGSQLPLLQLTDREIRIAIGT